MSDDLLPALAPMPDEMFEHEVEQWERGERETRWLPRTPDAAEWAALRLREAQDEYAVLEAEVEEYQRRVTAWAQAKLTKGYGGQLLRQIEFLRDRLRVFALMQRENSPRGRNGEPKIKTVELPSARIRTKKVGARKGRVEVTDHDALLEWAREHAPLAIVEHVDPTLLNVRGDDATRQVVTPEGEPVPGLSWTPPVEGRVEAYVDLTEDEYE